MFKKKIGQSTNFTENIAFAQLARTSFCCSAVGGGQTDRRLGEKLTKLGRGPAELPKDLVSGGNLLTWKQVISLFLDGMSYRITE